jgi:pimeloyl-ACP methyl ester carboxylesterase
MEVPETRYAQSGDLSIAYQVFGEGPRDIVFVPGFISHCDLSWDTTLLRGIAERLASFARVITFDKRGTGLSERTLGFGSAEDRMDDIRAVMDAAQCERAAIIGISDGGPLAVLFAATYPARATALVLWETFARILAAPDYAIGLDPPNVDGFIGALIDKWGSGEALRLLVQHFPTDDKTSAFVARYERNAATPTGVREIMRRNVEVDVRSVLAAVSAPTLVLHRRSDPAFPLRLGKYLADNIRGARFCELPGDWHMNGDGFLAAFDGPGRAINCAQAIASDAGALGLEVRAGLHTGECELRGDDLAGIAVHIGARVAALAGPGEVLVTSTVRDLVAGSGIEFTDRGVHELKGVPGRWDLLAVRG